MCSALNYPSSSASSQVPSQLFSSEGDTCYTRPRNIHIIHECLKLDLLFSSHFGPQTWTCEFCGTVNSVDIVEEEIPTNEDVTYMISPAPATTSSLAADVGGPVDQSIIIFCVDVSGSMCVTTEVCWCMTELLATLFCHESCYIHNPWNIHGSCFSLSTFFFFFDKDVSFH